jgi:hypothetical protein
LAKYTSDTRPPDYYGSIHFEGDFRYCEIFWYRTRAEMERDLDRFDGYGGTITHGGGGDTIPRHHSLEMKMQNGTTRDIAVTVHHYTWLRETWTHPSVKNGRVVPYADLDESGEV